jgi:hypothetical protein
MGKGQLLAEESPATAATSRERASKTNVRLRMWNGPTVSFDTCQKSINSKLNDDADGWIIINHSSTKEANNTRPKSCVPLAVEHGMHFPPHNEVPAWVRGEGEG